MANSPMFDPKRLKYSKPLGICLTVLNIAIPLLAAFTSGVVGLFSRYALSYVFPITLGMWWAMVLTRIDDKYRPEKDFHWGLYLLSATLIGVIGAGVVIVFGASTFVGGFDIRTIVFSVIYGAVFAFCEKFLFYTIAEIKEEQ